MVSYIFIFFSRSLLHTHTHLPTHRIALSLSLKHTHTHIHSISLSLLFFPSLSYRFSISVLIQTCFSCIIVHNKETRKTNQYLSHYLLIHLSIYLSIYIRIRNKINQLKFDFINEIIRSVVLSDLSSITNQCNIMNVPVFYHEANTSLSI